MSLSTDLERSRRVVLVNAKLAIKSYTKETKVHNALRGCKGSVLAGPPAVADCVTPPTHGLCNVAKAGW